MWISKISINKIDNEKLFSTRSLEVKFHAAGTGVIQDCSMCNFLRDKLDFKELAKLVNHLAMLRAFYRLKLDLDFSEIYVDLAVTIFS